MFSNKKGTEKPIEIFVALFVILAVALLLLQLFQSQLTDQQQELDQFQREAQQQALRSDATSYCRTKCSEASADRCSLRSLANFCTSYASDRIRAPDFLDLNMDGVMNRDTSLLVGVGVCEDAVPCHAMISDCCGRRITASSCLEILRDYWATTNVNVDPDAGSLEDLGCLVESTVREGTCGMEGSTWFDSTEITFGTGASAESHSYASLAALCTTP